ncbi:MAG: hypothetical protein WBL21_06040 [Salinimicrobium sp.]
MTIQEQLSTVKGGTDSFIGSGPLGRKITAQTIKHFYFLATGTILTEALSRSYIRTLQKAGKLIPLMNVYNVAWANGENEVGTAPNSGVESMNRRGLPKLTGSFDNGEYFRKVIQSMEGNNRWDVIIIDEDETQFLTSYSGVPRGFKVGMFAMDNTPLGGDEGKASFTIQFTKSLEFSKYLDWITDDLVDYVPSEIDGSNQVRLSLSGAVAAATTLTVKTVLDNDNDTFIAGLTKDNFLIKVDGATRTVSDAVADPVTKTYALTIDTAPNVDQKVVAQLYNSADNQPVVQIGTEPEDILVQSREAVAVAAAA